MVVQDWVEKIAERLLLNACSSRGACINVVLIKIGARHEVLNVLGFLDFPGAALSGASLTACLLENPCKNRRQ